MTDAEFIEQLRRNLPRLLRDHPEVRHELWEIMLEVFPSRQEFMELLQEMRAFREDTNQRFQELREDMDRRFEAVDRRFEAIIEELRFTPSSSPLCNGSSGRCVWPVIAGNPCRL